MSLKQFCDEVPVLALIGEKHPIYMDEPYSIDKDVQLVCKYLRRFDVGGTRGIDKLYNEGVFLSQSEK